MSVDQPAHDRIVVGVDGSVQSQQALRWAAFLAGATGATLEAVMVWESVAAYGFATVGWTASAGDLNPTEHTDRVLADTLEEVFGKDQPPGLQATVREGTTAKMLLETSHDARMLVVGSRGHGGFTGLLLGSVSAAVAEHATCPVLVVHGTTPPPPT